jgi:hypothetical protein
MSKPSLAKASRVAAILPAEDGDVLITAAFLYDVGYSPSLNRRRRRPRRGRATGRWAALPVAGDPLLDAVDLHGAHDFRHTYATWLEDAGIPAPVIDELMGHQASSRGGHLPLPAHHPGDGRPGR